MFGLSPGTVGTALLVLMVVAVIGVMGSAVWWSYRRKDSQYIIPAIWTSFIIAVIMISAKLSIDALTG